MSALPPFAVEDLEFAVKFADAAWLGHVSECTPCSPGDPNPTCIEGMSLCGATMQARLRLDAAKSQQPERHIMPGTVAERRRELDRMLGREVVAWL